MKNVLICGLRPWSIENIKPAIDTFNDSKVNFIYWNMIDKLDHDIKKFNLIITCEPHITHWFEFYPLIPKNIPILAMQQGMFYSRTKKNGTWNFDYYMVWGEQMKICTIRNGLDKNKIFVTGNPKHDVMFNIATGNLKYNLVLLDGVKNRFKPQYENQKVIHHPNKYGFKLVVDTFNLVRNANLVAFQFTGCGVWALIMGKKCHIYKNRRELELKYQGLRGEDRGSYITVDPSKNTKWIEWAVTDNGATERVKKIIRRFL